MITLSSHGESVLPTHDALPRAGRAGEKKRLDKWAKKEVSTEATIMYF